EIMNDCLADICRKHPDVAFSTSGIDMSKALVIKKRNENGNMVPDPDGAYKILFRAFEKGLLVISLAGNRLRLQPPLNIKPENLKRGFEIIEEAIVDYKAGLITDECLKYRNGW
ncbi:MAG: aspartate aminotransferase family protein, partial [Anaerotignum sp.]|nr:aspartate aminotransferase family protein [Anaerotignum sp.]